MILNKLFDKYCPCLTHKKLREKPCIICKKDCSMSDYITHIPTQQYIHNDCVVSVHAYKLFEKYGGVNDK